MNNRERKEMNNLTKDVVGQIDELYRSYRMKVAEAIENEEEKAERLEEYFYSSSRIEEIQEDIETLENTLAIFEEAVDMMKGVEDV